MTETEIWDHKMKPLTIQNLIIDESLFAPARGERCVLSECRAACCQNGAWIDEGHAMLIMKHKAKIAALLPEERRDANLWFDEEREDKDFPSGIGLSCVSVEDPNDASRGACVFLLPNYYCALQVVSEEMKLPYPGLKPIDCALYPILRSGGRLMLDTWSPENLTGADCQRTAHGAPRPVFEVFADEVRLVLGEDGLVKIAQT
jgi:hypothetical protein